MASPLHVLIVDDSAVARMALEEALGHQPGIRVSLAGDGQVAQARIKLDPPDVILLDLDMPRMAALDLLRWVAANRPVPVVGCTSSGATGDIAVRALGAGAAAVVDLPVDGAIPQPTAQRILDGVRRAHRERAGAPVTAGAPERSPARPQPPSHTGPLPVVQTGRLPRLTPSRRAVGSDIIAAIGASTGGTEALAALLPALPPEFPGIVIVQHMPAVFTRTFAERLDKLCALRVREAADGDRVEDGVALIAPGGRHTRIARRAGGFVVEVFDGPEVSKHRPSVDVLFHSVARSAGPDALGVIMTGMGSDGAAGLAEMHDAGARTIGQDEASSTVYGMPRVAAELGAVDVVASLEALPLQMIAAAERLRRRA